MPGGGRGSTGQGSQGRPGAQAPRAGPEAANRQGTELSPHLCLDMGSAASPQPCSGPCHLQPLPGCPPGSPSIMPMMPHLSVAPSLPNCHPPSLLGTKEPNPQGRPPP